MAESHRERRQRRPRAVLVSNHFGTCIVPASAIHYDQSMDEILVIKPHFSQMLHVIARSCSQRHCAEQEKARYRHMVPC